LLQKPGPFLRVVGVALQAGELLGESLHRGLAAGVVEQPQGEVGVAFELTEGGPELIGEVDEGGGRKLLGRYG
jgi:hypothetical protein